MPNDFISQNFTQFFGPHGDLFASGKPEFETLFEKLRTLADEFDVGEQTIEAEDDFFSMFSDKGKEVFSFVYEVL